MPGGRCYNAPSFFIADMRVYFAMARDGLFFSRAAEVSPHMHTPAFSLIIQAVWTSPLALSGTYSELLEYVILAQLLFYALTVAGMFVLRKKRPGLERPYRAFGYPVLPCLYLLLAVFIVVDLPYVKPKFTWPGLMIVLTGVPVFFFWRKRRVRQVKSGSLRQAAAIAWDPCAKTRILPACPPLCSASRPGSTRSGAGQVAG